MKNIQDILKKKKALAEEGEAKVLDEKTIARVFLEVAKHEIRNLEDADIREIRQNGKTLYIKTTHPIVSSELFLRRETIIDKLNKIAGENVIERIVI